MMIENKTIIRILAVIVMLGGILVMAGWLLNIPQLTSILPQWVTMKFSTALSFFLSGLILFIMIRIFEGKTQILIMVTPLLSLLIVIMMSILLISVFTGVSSNIEDLFVQEAEGAVKTTVPGRPSVGTMVSFILIAIVGFLSVFDPEDIKKPVRIIGITGAVLAILAIIGYVINVPLLYYTIPGWSTAMAFHTALFFLFLSMGLILLGIKDIFVKREMKQNED